MAAGAVSADVMLLAPLPVSRFFDAATGDHLFTIGPTEVAAVQADPARFVAEGTPWLSPQPGQGTVDVFRFFDIETGGHFLTTSAAERAHVNQLSGYRDEGVAFQAYATAGVGREAVERFFNASNGQHTYALLGEADQLRQTAATTGWVDEGRAFFIGIGPSAV